VVNRFSPFSHGVDEQTACAVKAPVALLYVTPSRCVRGDHLSSVSASAFAFVRSVELNLTVGRIVSVTPEDAFPAVLPQARRSACAASAASTCGKSPLISGPISGPVVSAAGPVISIR
jgi:hypothetical protein